MKTIAVLCLTASIAFALPTTTIDPYANIKYYDGVIDTIDTKKFANPVLMRGYVDCFLEQGPCGDIAQRIKKVIKHSIETYCVKCSPLQKQAAKKFMEEISKLYPEDFVAFQKKYDPEFKYFEKFLVAIREENK